MCFCTYYCCCVAITVVRERHVERCGPAAQLDRLAPATRRRPICKYSKRAGYGRSTEKRTCMCVCMWDVHHVNMGVCCMCVRVCICEPVLTIVFLRVLL